MAKKILIFILVFLIAIALVRAQSGCCLNPNAGIITCDTMQQNPLTSCCPQPKEDFPEYYSNGDHPWGPVDYSDCYSVNYFRENTDCDTLPECTTMGCCCRSGGGYLKEDPVSQAECEVDAESGLEFYEGTTDCIAECGVYVPECSDGIDNDGNGCADWIGGDTGCENINDDNESGGTCPGADCNDANYVPELRNLIVIPTKGEKQIELSWQDTCQANYYEIERCKGNNCNDFVAIDTSSNRNFIDSDSALEWDNYYTYKIIAHYNIQTATPSITNSGFIGNLECWKQYTENYFCIHASYYDNEPIKSYMQENGINKDSSKYNKAYYCSQANALIEEGTSCSYDQICVVINNQPGCFVESECKIETGNPFGMYYNIEICETSNYCFLDRSQSQVDSCYRCMTAMSCYDYKSQAACTRDNCNVGNCEWHSTISVLGIGVCVSTVESNCKWCDKKGTSGMENLDAYNEIFDICTEAKSNALSVGGYPCYYEDGESISCEYTRCSDYLSESDCGLGNRQNDENNNLINPSSDSCEIGVCEWYPGESVKCRKNADARGTRNTEPDCSVDDSSCEEDYFKPDTTLIPNIDQGIYDSLSIEIFDKKSVGGLTRKVSSRDYKTYLCVYSETECETDGHPYDKYVNELYLEINGLYLFERGNPDKYWNLYEGTNHIKYYSQDSSKNIGVVKEVTIEAHADESKPEVASIEISGATKVGDTFYTKYMTPTITVKFYLDAEITYNRLSGPITRTLSPSPSGLTQTVSFTPASALSEGSYTFEFNAKDANNVYMDNNYVVNFVIDTSIADFDITPAHGSVVNFSNVFFSFSFSEEVKLEEVTINGIDAKGNFSSDYGTEFTATINLNDGTKELIVKAKDRSENLIEGISIFSVNAISELDFRLIEPSHGVANSTTFDIVLETDNDAICAFNLDSDMDYSLMLISSPFDTTGGIRHEKDYFNEISDDSTHKLYVKCNDIYHGISSAIFDLRVDETEPVILDYYAYPDPVVESHYTTTLYVRTDEDTICRYSKTVQEYESMENEFTKANEEDYRTIHNQNVTESGEGDYSYYVACENLAELKSSSVVIDFTIDLSYPLIITDRSERYSNDTSVRLAFETNKITQCYYSPTDPGVAIGTLFGPPSYNHVVPRTLDSGIHTFYVKCLDPRTGDWSYTSTTIIVDTTEPYMIFVSDNSTLSNNTEQTWRTGRLRVKWLGDDNETGTVDGSRTLKYYYMLEEYYAPRQTLVNWTLSSEEDDWMWVKEYTNGSRLNLIDGEKYRFSVKPKNIVDLIGDEMESDGIEINVALKPTHCENGRKDKDETDVDCGGSCEPCDLNKSCNTNLDCDSGYCNSYKKCDIPTCSDEVKQTVNGETDVDCGGSKCPKCADSKKCNINSDCDSGYCDHGVCGAKDSCSDGRLSSGESDVDCGGPCSCCELNNYCDIDIDCCGDAKCINGKCSECAAIEDCDDGIDNDCDGLVDKDDSDCQDTDGDGMPDEWEIANGLDPNDPNDANLDNDQDGLTNIEEYNIRYTWGQSTDPNNRDTDGDGFTDLEEIRAGTDPTDPESYPASNVWSILLLILGILILLGGGGYLAYTKLMKPKEEKKLPPLMPMPRMPPKMIRPVRAITPKEKRLAELIKKKKEEKIEKRKKLFEAFKPEEKEKEKKIEEKIKEKKKVEIKIKKPEVKVKPKEIKKLTKVEKPVKRLEKKVEKLKVKKPREEVFKELKKLAGKHKKGKSQQLKQLKGLKENIVLATVSAKDYQKSNMKIIKQLIGKDNIPGVYVSLSKPFKTIKKTLKKDGIDTKKIMFIDAVSQIMGPLEKTDRCLFIGPPERLSDISIAIGKAVRALPSKDRFVFFDNLNVLLLYNNIEIVVRFIHFLTSKMKAWKVKSIIILLRKKEDKEFIGQLARFSDITLDLD